MSQITKQSVFPPNAPKPVAPFTPAVIAGDFVYVSGSLGVDKNHKLVDGGTAAQAQKALENLKDVLEAAGSDLDLVLKTTVFLINMKDFQAVNEVYAKAFNGKFPARTCFAVQELPMKASVEIEAVALRRKPLSKL